MRWCPEIDKYQSKDCSDVLTISDRWSTLVLTMPKLGLFVRRQLRKALEPAWATTTLLFGDKNSTPERPSKSDLHIELDFII